MIKSTPGIPPVVADKLCVVYEQNTGRVIHMHRVTTLKGGREPQDAEIHATALEHGTRMHKDVKREEMRTTFVDPKTFQAGASHKIDLKTLQLVATLAENGSFEQ